MATRKPKPITDEPVPEDPEEADESNDTDVLDLLDVDGAAAKATSADLTTEEAVELVAGTVRDYVTGRQVRATPEEVQAVQVFARRLVEDYDYDKKQITTRPQY